MISFISMYVALIRFWDKYRLKKLKFGYIGNNVKIRPNFRLGHTENLILHDNIVLGENIFINAHGGVEIGSGTITGPDVMIFSVNHIYDTDECLPFGSGLQLKKVSIGENCWIGARSFICPGVEIGEGCVIAAGAVVSRSVPPLSVVGGNPATIIKCRDAELYRRAKAKNEYHVEIARRD